MLSERQRLILSAIVDDYIRSAEPVGSRSISKRGDVSYSPATIRNEMSDLEELGYLEQPHTSAGRIPSNRGYRYYVDHLVHNGQLEAVDQSASIFKSVLADRLVQIEQIIQQVSDILSNLTNYTSIVLGPEVFNASLKHLQLIPLGDNRAVAIIVTSTGHVENKLVTIPEGLPISEIEKTVRILNMKLSGVPLYHLKSKLYNEIATELSRHVTHYEELLHSLDSALVGEGEHRVFMSGTSKILSQPEFKDVDKVKPLLDLFDQSDMMAKMVSSDKEGILVRIGSENSMEVINDCSLITATYSLNGKPIGTIGILGPTRMEYGRVIHLLSRISKDFSQILTQWYN